MKAIFTLITMLILTSLSAQIDTAHSFYNLTPNKVDLHYHLKWLRSTTTVTLTNGKMITPKDQWFQTGATKLTGYGYISNDYKVTNSSGTSKLKIELIDTLTGIKITKLDTVVNGSNINTSTIYLDRIDTGTYYIRFTYTNVGSNSSAKLEMSTFNIVNSIALPLVEIKHKRDTTKTITYKDVKILHSDDGIKLLIEETNDYDWSIYSIDGKLISSGSGTSTGIVTIPYQNNQISIIVVNALGKVSTDKI
jgi:hypothetical protein